MPSFNRVILMGNLTRDPEVKYTPKGTAVATVALAINRNYTTDSGEKREEVTFVDVEFWGRQAEIAGEYLKKGHPCHIEGRLKLEVWDDKETGQKRSKMKVVGEGLQLLSSREREETKPQTQQRATKPPQQRKPPIDPDLDGVDEDSVPF